MSPILVLATVAVLLRLVGAAGGESLASWSEAVRAAVGVTFVLMGSAHFTPMREDIRRMVPAGVPRPAAVVLLLGVWQMLGGIGLLVDRWREAAAVVLVVLLLLKLPANVAAARGQRRLGGRYATPPGLRVATQLAWLGLVWWTAYA